MISLQANVNPGSHITEYPFGNLFINDIYLTLEQRTLFHTVAVVLEGGVLFGEEQTIVNWSLHTLFIGNKITA